MAGIDEASSKREISFRFYVPNISALNHDGIWSSTFQIKDVPWRINVCKIGQGRNKNLAIFLHCDKYDKNVGSSNWSYMIYCRFKLLASLEEHSIEFYLPLIFDNENRFFGEDSLIKWRDLFDETKQYVKNDTIIMVISLEMANPNDVHTSELKLENIGACFENGALRTFRLTVLNVENLMAVRSPYIEWRNKRWIFTVLSQIIEISEWFCQQQLNCHWSWIDENQC